MDILQNPAGRDSEYLDGLNACFPGWGGRKTFDWAFHKSGGLPATDFLVAEEAGRFLAGSAITYRRLALAGGETMVCATVTASWRRGGNLRQRHALRGAALDGITPASRHRGIFMALIQQSRAVARGRGCAFLSAYVRDENTSGRQLLAAGAVAVPASYFQAGPQPPGETGSLPVEIAPDEAWQSRRPPEKLLHYDYDKAEWLAQFLNRPGPVTMLRTANGAIAVVHGGQETDRLLELYPATPEIYPAALDEIRYRAFKMGKSLSTYSVTPWAVSALRERGFQQRSGAVLLFALQGDAPPWQAADCWISDGDRM